MEELVAEELVATTIQVVATAINGTLVVIRFWRWWWRYRFRW
jgi:hypothetical protein